MWKEMETLHCIQMIKMVWSEMIDRKRVLCQMHGYGLKVIRWLKSKKNDD